MSKPMIIVVGLVLAIAGFGLGRMSASAPGASSREAVPPLAPTQASPAAGVSGSGAAELEAILGDKDPYSRASRLGTLLPTLGPDAVPAVAAIMRDTSVQLGAVETELMVRFWATHDPERASIWAFRSPLGYRVAAVVPAVELWARADPQTAVRKAQGASIDHGTANRAAQIAVIRGWYLSGKPGLLDHIRSLGSGVDQQRAVSTLSREMIRTEGTEATIRWAEALPDEPPQFKTDAYRQIGSELAMTDLDAALRWCDAHCDGPHGEALRQLIAQRWAAKDGKAALEWLSTSPAGQERDLAVRVSYNAWRQNDAAEAFAWMEGHGIDGVEPWMLPTIVIYAKFRSADSPADAVEWAALIEDDVEREFTMVRIARRWRAQDEAAAEAWLQQSSLSEPVRESARTTKMDAPIPVTRSPGE